jgi:hypothetical protein
MMAIVGGIHFIAAQPRVICISSSGLSGAGCATRMRVTLRQAFGQMQKHLRLHRGRQMLAIVVISREAAPWRLIAQA